MNIGINIYSKWDYKEIINAFLENGISKTFVCAEHPKFDEVMKALEKADITVENLHAPIESQNTIWAEGEEGDYMFESLCNGIDSCVKYNIKIMVAHVSNGRPMPKISNVGLKRLDRFIEYAKKRDIMIAFENHRYLENVKYIMDRYPEAGFCLDTSHEHGFTPGVRYMPIWGHRLMATHLSDNEVLCDKDMHMLPFDGIIDFKQTAREIAECGKDVALMLEVKPGNHKLYENMSIRDYYKEAAKRITRFGNMVDSYKKQI